MFCSLTAPGNEDCSVRLIDFLIISRLVHTIPELMYHVQHRKRVFDEHGAECASQNVVLTCFEVNDLNQHEDIQDSQNSLHEHNNENMESRDTLQELNYDSFTCALIFIASL